MPSERRGDRSQKLQQGKYQLGKKKIQFTVKLVKHWNRLSREAVGSPFGDFQGEGPEQPILSFKLDLLGACWTSWPLKVSSKQSDSMNKENLRWFTPDQNSLWEKVGFVRDPILSMGAMYNVLKLSLTGSPTIRRACRWKSKTKADYRLLLFDLSNTINCYLHAAI